MFYPCFFPSDNVWRSQCAGVPQCAHFSTVITPSWITQQISAEKCAHRIESARVGSAKQCSKLSLGPIEHGQNITTPMVPHSVISFICFLDDGYRLCRTAAADVAVQPCQFLQLQHLGKGQKTGSAGPLHGSHQCR